MKVNASFSFKLLSHPEKVLKDHLLQVAEHCQYLLNKKSINHNLFVPKHVLSDVTYLIGLSHDFGKSTAYFQDYLTEQDEINRRKLKARRETNHSLLSALFCYYLLDQYIDSLDETSFLTNLIPILSFIIVKKHHGNLKDAATEILDLEDDDLKVTITHQMDSIDGIEIDEILSCGLQNLDLQVSFGQFKQKFLEIYQTSILRKGKRLIRKLGSSSKIAVYFLHQLLYSILLEADKNDAIFKTPLIQKRIDIQKDIVDTFKHLKGFDLAKTRLNTMRNDIYNEVTSSLTETHKISSLNAPTGTGKTLTALSYALKLRSQIQRTQGYLPRIIYCLPFMSIIDQNFEVFYDIFSTVGGNVSVNTSLLLKHHHLSDISYKNELHEFETHESEFLIEGWNSEVIVTTFIQLFHSIISNRNRAIRKFHNMINSIIILDEVQSIPHKYWLFLKKVIKFLASVYNVRFIFMTATLPLIFSRAKSEIYELLPKYEYYFQQLNRINLNLVLGESIRLEEFKEQIQTEIITQKNKDFLIVLNTISASRQVFNSLKSVELEDTHLYYLSTHVIPKERLSRINQIKQDPKRKVIVSTQLIEAGVDIDVDITYRDFAPLDAIHQVAGRCNRNNASRERGEVFIVMLRDEKQEYYRYIYDSFLISKTLEVLQNKPQVQESQFLTLNNEYFDKISQTHSSDTSKTLLASLTKLEFKKLATKFKLIEEQPYKVDVFLECDEAASIVWQKFKNLADIKDPFERRTAFLKLKKDFYSYVISVNRNHLSKLPKDHEKIIFLSREELDFVYSQDTGFIPSPPHTSIIF